ncbi:MAG: acyltransferase, partial [Candidatus Eremiobacteraeota bacterium]|nr:acyltransferase [Candidatus Eremiobacteraeota bacterium]
LFDGTPQQTLRAFASRRAAKILPSYVFVIAILTGLGLAKFSSSGDELKEIARHLLFIHTFWDESYGSINGVLWSLAIEVQFYVVFPAIAWAAMRRPASTFVAMAVVANAYRLAVVGHYDVVHQMDQLPGTLDLFGGGMLAAYLFRRLAVRAPRLAARRLLWTLVALGGFSAFAAIVESAFAARVLEGWPMNWHVYGRPALVAAFLAMTLGSLFAFRTWQQLLANRALVFLAAISYNLYLWHQPVARALLAARLPPWSGASEHADAAWGLAYSVWSFVAATAVAALVTFAVERPLLRLPRRRHAFAAGPARRTV